MPAAPPSLSRALSTTSAKNAYSADAYEMSSLCADASPLARTNSCTLQGLVVESLSTKSGDRSQAGRESNEMAVKVEPLTTECVDTMLVAACGVHGTV